MVLKYMYRYRIESARLKGYDYSRDGAYFITICTKNKFRLFGEIKNYNNDECVDVETGLRPVSTSTQPTPQMILSNIGQIVTGCWYDLPNHYPNIRLDEFIVMPDHIHGIIIIRNGSDNKLKHGLSEFIRAFKSFSSRRINELNKTKISIWQPRFHDHIIRSDNELNRIRLYIKNNPTKFHD